MKLLKLSFKAISTFKASTVSWAMIGLVVILNNYLRVSSLSGSSGGEG